MKGIQQIAHKVGIYDKKWYARTRFTIDSLPNCVLEVETNRHDELITTAVVYNCNSESMTHLMGTDYFKVMMRNKPRRGTEQNIRAQHDDALDNIDLIIKAVKQHYSK